MSEAIKTESSAVNSSSDLPPARDQKDIRPVSPPLSNTPLRRFNYYIALFAALFIAFYSWRLFQWKSDVGGWWNLAMGKRPPGADAVLNPAHRTASPSTSQHAENGDGKLTVESRIEDLAAALGMPASDLAAAIADAVREHVPPASLSSIAAHEPSGTAVQWLVDPSAAAEQQTPAAAASVAGGMEAVANAFGAAVGLDEPPSEFVLE